MRKKISKRRRRESIALGARIIREGWIREPGWKRKDAGYEVKAEFNGLEIVSSGNDELDTYHLLLDFIKDEGFLSWITQNNYSQRELEIYL